jgi:light-regulated signal transduction histidine kinase (bacteriophytochrome)
LGQFFSIELVSKEQHSRDMARLKINKIVTMILEQIASENNLAEGLLKDTENLMNLMESQGAALCFDNRLTLLGQTPDKERVIALIEWLGRNNKKKVFVTGCLSDDYPPAREFKDTASGIIAISIPKSVSDYIIWFRPEHVLNLVWAGNPHKPLSNQDGNIKLSPRNSFESWTEISRFRSLPWNPVQIEAANEMYDMIVHHILNKFLLDQKRIGKEVDKRTQ